MTKNNSTISVNIDQDLITKCVSKLSTRRVRDNIASEFLDLYEYSVNNGTTVSSLLKQEFNEETGYEFSLCRLEIELQLYHRHDVYNFGNFTQYRKRLEQIFGYDYVNDNMTTRLEYTKKISNEIKARLFKLSPSASYVNFKRNMKHNVLYVPKDNTSFVAANVSFAKESFDVGALNYTRSMKELTADLISGKYYATCSMRLCHPEDFLCSITWKEHSLSNKSTIVIEYELTSHEEIKRIHIEKYLADFCRVSPGCFSFTSKQVFITTDTILLPKVYNYDDSDWSKLNTMKNIWAIKWDGFQQILYFTEVNNVIVLNTHCNKTTNGVNKELKGFHRSLKESTKSFMLSTFFVVECLHEGYVICDIGGNLQEKYSFENRLRLMNSVLDSRVLSLLSKLSGINFSLQRWFPFPADDMELSKQTEIDGILVYRHDSDTIVKVKTINTVDLKCNNQLRLYTSNNVCIGKAKKTNIDWKNRVIEFHVIYDEKSNKYNLLFRRIRYDRLYGNSWIEFCDVAKVSKYPFKNFDSYKCNNNNSKDV